MASTFENVSSFATYFPTATAIEDSPEKQAYDSNRHRIYALSFWMTDNELIAEELMEQTFRRAFRSTRAPSAELLDQMLIAQLRERMPLGQLTLNCADCTEVSSVRRNTLRAHLERAVVQLPATERMVYLMHDAEGYDHARIASALGLTQDQSRHALHQARLRIRELLAAMIR